MQVQIFHNPRCSKSRKTLQLLLDRGIEPQVIEYLKTPPTHEELARILRLLEIQPRDLIRKKEAEYREAALDDPELSDDALIEAMVRFPKLIERPIVVAANKAALGRPPERVLELIER